MKILITGGTGTIGKALTNIFLTYEHEVYIYSRDEFKQSRLPNNHNIKKTLGDIRDERKLEKIVPKMDLVIHAAALKQVDTAESNIDECIDVNVRGTQVVSDLCDKYQVKMILLSTDKAVFPINTYGMSKALAEKIVRSKREQIIIRYGNVLDSRGSVIEKFYNAIQNQTEIPITDTKMTRFWIKQADVAEFIFMKVMDFVYGLLDWNKKIYIPSMKAANILDLKVAVIKVSGANADIDIPKWRVIGMRPGEKIHECLYNRFCELDSIHYTKKELYSDDFGYRYTNEELCSIVEEQLTESGYLK